MFVSYDVPYAEVYDDWEMPKQKKHASFRVTGELLLHTPTAHPTTLFSSDLLPGMPSIHHMAKTATWLATQHHFLVWFMFNGIRYTAFPYQEWGDIVKLWHYEDKFKMLTRYQERINALEDEVKDLQMEINLHDCFANA